MNDLKKPKQTDDVVGGPMTPDEIFTEELLDLLDNAPVNNVPGQPDRDPVEDLELRFELQNDDNPLIPGAIKPPTFFNS